MHLSSEKKQKLQEYFTSRPVKKVYLFGSYARGAGEAGKSDIDLLVELDYSRPIGLLFVQMVLDLQLLLESPVDLVTTDGLSKYVVPFVESDKQLIYERAA